MAYNKDTDYTKLINDAVAKGDYASAAQYELSRNEKVADLNKTGGNIWNAQITNDYSQYLPQNQNVGLNTDLHAIGTPTLNTDLHAIGTPTLNTDLHTVGTPTLTPLVGSVGGGGGTPSKGTPIVKTPQGSAVGVGVFDNVQQTIKDQMNQNSLLWWNASPEDKLKLEAQNQQLAAQLGGNVSYNAGTGTWSGDAGRPTFDMSQLGEKPTLDLSQLGDRPTFDMSQYMGNMPTFDMSQLGQKPTIDLSQLGDKPTYDSQYGAQIDAMLQQVLNRDKFSYDAESDPLYQQYKAQYNREGTRAMNDTLASMASGAGGMNTWAVTAAQQANDYHMAQLADKVPELYQLAYSMYMDDYNRDVQNLGLLTNAENDAYGRYRDTVGDFNTERDFQYGMGRDQINDWYKDFDMNYGVHRDQMGDWYNMLNFGYGMNRDQVGDWFNDRNFLTDQHNSALGQWNADRNFNYGAFMDQMNAWESDRDFNYGAGQDALDNEWRGKEWDRLLGLDQEDRDRWNKEWETDNNRYTSEEGYARAMDMIAMGVMPDEATLAAAGLSPEMATAMIYKLFPDQAPPSTGGPGGPGGPAGPGDGLEDDLLGDPTIDYDSVNSLGFGPQNEEWLAEMEARGVITSTETDGKIVFSLTPYGELVRREAMNGDVPVKNNNDTPTTQPTTTPTPAPNAPPGPTPTPPPVSSMTDMTGTAGIGAGANTAWEWILNQILRKN